ncbi:MAG: NAD(P)/FAD-dependent oxidoreductase [Chloroflexi bacterium]|nr:MAG: NAD(P)/FAD-dependent oxidoreductase [Chloroflexota bacterium]
MDADLAVIGGGPVGSTLALLAARAGRRVTVIEKGRLPRDKPCGEGLLPSGVRVLASAGIDLAAEGFPVVAGVRYRLEGGPTVRGDLQPTPGRGVRRTRFDALLAERAAATPGVTLVCACAASAVRVEPGAVRVETAAGPLRARAVVAADGLRSATARWLGWARQPEGRGRHALVGHLAAGPQALGDEVVVTLLDGMEVYAAPAGPDEALVALLAPRGSLRRPGATVTESYLEAVRRAHPGLAGAPLTGRVRGAGPFWTRPRTVARDHGRADAGRGAGGAAVVPARPGRRAPGGWRGGALPGLARAAVAAAPAGHVAGAGADGLDGAGAAGDGGGRPPAAGAGGAARGQRRHARAGRGQPARLGRAGGVLSAWPPEPPPPGPPHPGETGSAPSTGPGRPVGEPNLSGRRGRSARSWASGPRCPSTRSTARPAGPR